MSCCFGVCQPRLTVQFGVHLLLFAHTLDESLNMIQCHLLGLNFDEFLHGFILSLAQIAIENSDHHHILSEPARVRYAMLILHAHLLKVVLTLQILNILLNILDVVTARIRHLEV